MKKDIYAEFTSLMGFLEEGVVDGEKAAKELGVDHIDLKLALSAWQAVKDNNEIKKKWIISIGKVINAMEKKL